MAGSGSCIVMRFSIINTTINNHIFKKIVIRHYLKVSQEGEWNEIVIKNDQKIYDIDIN